jgi:hypothetical protein
MQNAGLQIRGSETQIQRQGEGEGEGEEVEGVPQGNGKEG